jgi:cytochrome P450
VGDYLIEKDTDVLISPYITHRDISLWKDADKFIPERWDTEEVKEMDKFTYFPFAAGPRMCIGNNFALFEADIIIAKVVQKFIFEYLGEGPAEMEASTTLRVKNRAPIKISYRKK